MLTETVQRAGNREAGWVNRLFSNEGYTPEHQELKCTLHRKLLDRINLEALSAMAGERARADHVAVLRRHVREHLGITREKRKRLRRRLRELQGRAELVDGPPPHQVLIDGDVDAGASRHGAQHGSLEQGHPNQHQCRLQRPGRTPMDAETLLRGFTISPGTRFT